MFDKSNFVATVHAQCMNSSRNSKICPKTREKKKELKNANADANVEPKRTLNVCMFCVFLFFFFFWVFTCFRVMRLLFMHCFMNSSRKCWLFHGEQCTRALFTDAQISFFSNFFIKNGSHGTIHTFKIYFATVFSVFNFSKISSIQTVHENVFYEISLSQHVGLTNVLAMEGFIS